MKILPLRHKRDASNLLGTPLNQSHFTQIINKDTLAIGPVTSPSFCTSSSERVYITAIGCEIEFGGARDVRVAGAGGL